MGHVVRRGPPIAFGGNGWLRLLAMLAVRQLHYLAQERSKANHRWWVGLGERHHRRAGRMNEWTRYRIGRALKWILFLLLAEQRPGSVVRHRSDLEHSGVEASIPVPVPPPPVDLAPAPPAMPSARPQLVDPHELGDRPEETWSDRYPEARCACTTA